MRIINPTQDFKTIDIVLANGQRDSVNLQPGGRASLPDGSAIAPDKSRVYASWLKTAAEPGDSPVVTSPSTTK